MGDVCGLQGLVATTEVFHAGSGGGASGMAKSMGVPFLGKASLSLAALTCSSAVVAC